jgi:hypothetical protein
MQVWYSAFRPPILIYKLVTKDEKKQKLNRVLSAGCEADKQ